MLEGTRTSQLVSLAVTAEGIPIVSYLQKSNSFAEWNLYLHVCHSILCDYHVRHHVAEDVTIDDFVSWLVLDREGLAFLLYSNAGKMKLTMARHQCADQSCQSEIDISMLEHEPGATAAGLLVHSNSLLMLSYNGPKVHLT